MIKISENGTPSATPKNFVSFCCCLNKQQTSSNRMKHCKCKNSNKSSYVDSFVKSPEKCAKPDEIAAQKRAVHKSSTRYYFFVSIYAFSRRLINREEKRRKRIFIFQASLPDHQMSIFSKRKQRRKRNCQSFPTRKLMSREIVVCRQESDGGKKSSINTGREVQ